MILKDVSPIFFHTRKRIMIKVGIDVALLGSTIFYVIYILVKTFTIHNFCFNLSNLCNNSTEVGIINCLSVPTKLVQ